MKGRIGALAAGAAVCAAVLAAAIAGAATDLGRPACDYCRMILEHPDHGGVILTRSGERLLYDAVECMAAAVLTDSVPPRTIRRITVKDFRPPHAPIDAGRAVFLFSPTLESPMGQNLSAHASLARANAVRAKHPGELLDWAQVVARVNRIWFLGRLDAAGHAALPRPRR